MRWGCSSVGRASDRHAADACSIPGAARDFSPRINFQCRLSCSVRTHPCAIACINICAHVKLPWSMSRVRWIMEALKHPACTVGWVARLSQLAFPGEGMPNFPREKSYWDNTVVKSNKKIKVLLLSLLTLLTHSHAYSLYAHLLIVNKERRLNFGYGLYFL